MPQGGKTRSGCVPYSAPREESTFKVLVLFVLCKKTERDSNPERVSNVKKTLRGSVFSCEVRSGYAARREDAERLCPLQRAKRRRGPQNVKNSHYTGAFYPSLITQFSPDRHIINTLVTTGLIYAFIMRLTVVLLCTQIPRKEKFL